MMDLLRRATDAIVAQQDEERKAFLRGEVKANLWRPEKYAEAVLRAIDCPGATLDSDAHHRAVNALYGFARGRWGWGSDEYADVVDAVGTVLEAANRESTR